MNKWIWWLLVVGYMGIIFYLSHQPASDSNELSTNVTVIIVETVEKMTNGPSVSLGELNHIIRKNTHFFAYFGLALLLFKALSVSFRKWNMYVISWLIATLYAATDEFHQLYVPGRGGQVTDVLIDSSGAALAMICVFIFHKLRRHDPVTRL